MWHAFWLRVFVGLRDDSSFATGALAGHSNECAHLGIIVFRGDHLMPIDSPALVDSLVAMPCRRSFGQEQLSAGVGPGVSEDVFWHQALLYGDELASRARTFRPGR